MVNGNHIEVKFTNNFGGVYTLFVTEVWKEGSDYFFNPNTTAYSIRRVNKNQILFISIGNKKVHFSKGMPCFQE